MRRLCNERSVTARSMTSGLSTYALSVERRTPVTEVPLLLSVLEWPREDRTVFRLDLERKLTLVREMLALCMAVTKAEEDPDDDFRW